MIVKNIELEMDLTILGQSKPYWVYVDADIEFEFDDDWDLWIEKISLDSLIIVDRYNDAIQYDLDSVEVTKEVKDDVKLRIEKDNSEEFINDFLMDELENFNNGGKYE
jgi:hypothetical protein